MQKSEIHDYKAVTAKIAQYAKKTTSPSLRTLRPLRLEF